MRSTSNAARDMHATRCCWSPRRGRVVGLFIDRNPRGRKLWPKAVMGSRVARVKVLQRVKSTAFVS